MNATAVEEANVVRLPERKDVPEPDTWDLSRLFAGDDAWDEAFQKWESMVEGFEKFKGKLGNSAADLAACLTFDSEVDRLGERLGNYAFLKTTEDQANSEYQRMMGRFQNVAVKAAEAASFIRPEIMAIESETLAEFLEQPELELFKLALERVVRYKPHTLSEREEQLIAMQGEMAGATSKIFRQLTDADLKFGTVKNEEGIEVELSQSTFSQFLISPNREVRKTAFHQFYEQFTAHENSLAAILSGSIQKGYLLRQSSGLRQRFRTSFVC